MLSTDFPDVSWQRLRFDAARDRLARTTPLVDVFIGSIEATPTIIGKLMEISATALEQSTDLALTGYAKQIDALATAFRQFYDEAGGRAIVQQQDAQLVAEIENGPRLGRPRLSPDPQLERAPLVTGTPSPYEPVQIVIDANASMQRLQQDMLQFAQRLSVSQSFFADLQVDDIRVRVWAPSELALLLNVTVTTLTNWRKLGYGPKFVVVGSRADAVRYPAFRVIEWLTDTATPDGTQLDTEL
jgi:hypothetical protein